MLLYFVVAVTVVLVLWHKQQHKQMNAKRYRGGMRNEGVILSSSLFVSHTDGPGRNPTNGQERPVTDGRNPTERPDRRTERTDRRTDGRSVRPFL